MIRVWSSALARNDVALLNICGSADFVLQRHTLPIEDRYQQLGGRITVMIKDGAARHPHSPLQSQVIADWIEQHLLPATGTCPDFADERFIKSYYYSLERTNLWLKEEKTYANCRGPGFVECYDRYDIFARWPRVGDSACSRMISPLSNPFAVFTRVFSVLMAHN